MKHGKEKGETAVSKKNVDVGAVSWGNNAGDLRKSNDITGGAVQYAKEFINDKTYKGKVTSTLVYGVQWDATMQFFDNNYIKGNCEPNSYVRNSKGKGNYSGGEIRTGSNENYKVKNIYDMAGNLAEWTMESTVTYPVYRGSTFEDTESGTPASYRCYNPPYAVRYAGFRIALYLN